VKPEEIAERFEWLQVVLNQGPPCFYIEDNVRFCGRAKRWEGHTDSEEYPDHRFVSLAELLRRVRDGRA
jgi:hypothetical protein